MAPLSVTPPRLVYTAPMPRFSLRTLIVMMLAAAAVLFALLWRSDVGTGIVAITFGMVTIVGIAVGCLAAYERIEQAIWNFRNPPEKQAAEREAYVRRLHHPDWAFYERHLQRPVPLAIRQLYGDSTLIRSQGLPYADAEVISAFCPLDEQGMQETVFTNFPAVAIATTDFGDPIYLRPGPNETDVIYMTCHDGGDETPLASSAALFVERIRECLAKPVEHD